MVSLFSTYFSYLKKRRLALLVFMIVLSAVLGYLAVNINLEEDITKAIPFGDQGEKYQKVLKNFKFLDRVVFRVYHTGEKGKPGDLASFADEFTEKLKKSDVSSLISSYSVDLTEIDTQKVHAHFLDYLPLYMDEEKYAGIEKNLNEKSVANILGILYRNMISPAGMISGPMLRKDPLGLSFQAMKKLETLNPEDNFTVVGRHIFTKDKKNLIFFIQPDGSAVETGRNAELVDDIRKIIAELSEKSGGKIKAEFAGGLPIAVGSADRIKTDVVLSSMIAVLLVFFILLFHFRRIRFIPLIFLPAIFGGVTAVAAAWLIKTEISAIALGITSILLGITVDYAIHTVSHILKTKNAGKAISDISFPMVLSCFTTVSAFACLLFLDSPALNDLGLLSSVSVLTAMLFSITVLPHLVEFFGIPEDAEVMERKGLVGFLASKEYEKNRYLVIGVVVVTAVLYFFSDDVQFEDDLNSINYVRPEVQKALDNLDEISNVNKKAVYLVFEGNDLNEALEKREKAQKTLERYKKEGRIEAFNDVGEILLSKEKQHRKIERWNSFWDEKKKAKIKELLISEGAKIGFKEETFSDFYKLLDRKFEVVDPVELTKFAPHLFMNWITSVDDVMAATLLRVDSDKNPDLSQKAESEVDAFYFDRAGLMHKFVKFLKHDFEKLLLFSIITVFLLLFLLSGRLELAIAAMIPVIVSWLWTLGFMTILGLKFNIVNIIIVTFIFGLGIDYVAFVMRAKMQEYIYGDKEMAVSYKSSILVSCFTTVAGVGALLSAVHPALRSIALIAVLGMLSTLINSFVLAPAIFDWMLIKQKKKKAPPHTFLVVAYTFIAYANYVGFSLGLSGLGFGIFTTIPFRSAKRKRKWMYHFLIRIAARAVIFFAPHVRLRMINRHNVDLSKPSVIIANHQSFLDILMMLSLKTKIVMVTKSWVSNNPIFGKLVQFADFFTVTEGFEKMAPKLQDVVDAGYSIVVFPEGTRGDGKNLRRFHKGAFFLAEKLKLDIVPIVLHGSGHSIKKGEFSVRQAWLSYFVLPEVKYGSGEFGETYQDVCKGVSKMFKKEYAKVYEELGDVDFFRDRLIKNYIYKGPDIEWYVRIKTRLEKNYRFFDEIIPRDAAVTDLGCGMGMMVYMLSLTSHDRKFVAVDYDKDKIAVAENCFLNSERTKFESADILEYEPEPSDVFVLNDVLHYVPEKTHESIILKCAEKLNEGGFIIIRDGDTQLKKNHKNTEMTEKFSTGLGFNKTSSSLSFISGEMIENIASRLGFTYEIVKTQDKTSNRVFVLKKMEKTDV